MNGDKANQAPSNAKNVSRGRSTIEFSYTPLDDAEEVAGAIHQVGGTSCDWDQLATKLKQAPQGGGFRLRVAGARAFGLVSSDRGQVELTELGIQMQDPKRQRAARVEAFLHVPLHKQVFDQIKGQVIPPPLAIERMMESLGVAPKQKNKARQVFMRSAKLAGFFELSTERLTYPPNSNHDAGAGSNDAGHEGRKGGDDQSMHPFIRGLLDKLPRPESDWAVQGRVKWLQTAANIFDLIYTVDGKDSVSDIQVTGNNPKANVANEETVRTGMQPL